MSDKKVIVVTGATGTQGGSVVDWLLRDVNFHVRATTRNPTSAASSELRSRGVEVVTADLNDKTAVLQALREAYGVFGFTDVFDAGGAEAEVEQGKTLIDAAKETGVKHFVWSTLDHTPYPIAQSTGKAIIDDYLKQSGVPRTSLYTSWFYENIPRESMLFQRNKQGTIVLNAPLYATDGPLPCIYAADIGGYARYAFNHPEEWTGKDMRIASEWLTPRQMIDIVSRSFGEQIEFTDISMTDFQSSVKQTAIAQGDPMLSFWYNFKFFYENPEIRDVELTNKLVPGCVKFEEFVEKHKKEIVKRYKAN